MTYTIEVKKIQDLSGVEKPEEDFCSYLFKLIKRQQAEIEELKRSRDRWKQLAKDFDEASRKEEKKEKGVHDGR